MTLYHIVLIIHQTNMLFNYFGFAYSNLMTTSNFNAKKKLRKNNKFIVHAL